jgi:hypothetical protein
MKDAGSLRKTESVTNDLNEAPSDDSARSRNGLPEGAIYEIPGVWVANEEIIAFSAELVMVKSAFHQLPVCSSIAQRS